MREVELRPQAEQALRAWLDDVPFLRVIQVDHEPGVKGERPDFLVRVRLPDGEHRLVCLVKPSGQPRLARQAADQLARYQSLLDDSYGVFIAPYISPRAAEICVSEGVGYLDLAGNGRLSFDQVYIRREGKPNPFGGKRDLRSLYSPKAERVLRVLLCNPGRGWKVQELATEADVSLGQAHNVKELLLDRERLYQGPGGLQLQEPFGLLAEWAENYESERNAARDYYSLRPTSDIERELAEACCGAAARYALTGFSGAERVAPFVRYQRASAYVQGDIDAVADALGLKAVSSGANVTLLEPYDDGVFYDARSIQGTRVVSPVQLYLDLRRVKGRGEEAAEAILEQVLRREWQADETSTKSGR